MLARTSRYDKHHNASLEIDAVYHKNKYCDIAPQLLKTFQQRYFYSNTRKATCHQNMTSSARLSVTDCKCENVFGLSCFAVTSQTQECCAFTPIMCSNYMLISCTTPLMFSCVNMSLFCCSLFLSSAVQKMCFCLCVYAQTLQMIVFLLLLLSPPLLSLCAFWVISDAAPDPLTHTPHTHMYTQRTLGYT